MSSPSTSVKSFSLITTTLLVVSVVFAVLASAAVALRFYARKIKALRFEWDDWTVLFSLVMLWFYTLNTIVTGAIGGIDTTTMEPFAAARLFLRCLWLEGFPLGVGLATIKISILLFYRRIFVTKWFRQCVDVFVFVLIGWAISTVFAQLFCANPISGAWNPMGSNLLRYNYSAFALAVACMSLVFDVMVLCFPIPVIRTLHMPTRRKVSIAAIFWLGGFCCIAASLRLYFIYKGNHLVTQSTNTNRYSYATSEFVWAHIEPSCSIVAACLPTYGSFFTGNHTFEKFLGGFRSFISRPTGSYPSRRSPGGSGGGGGSGSKNSKGGAARSDSGLIVDSKTTDGKWPNLEISGVGDTNSVDIAGGAAGELKGLDLEAQELEKGGGTPLQIAVTRGFGTENRGYV